MSELVSDGLHWQSIQTASGEIWVLGFMRVEKVPYGRRTFRYRAWDVLRVPVVRPMHPTTLHKTLALAKTHCERIMNEHRKETT